MANRAPDGFPRRVRIVRSAEYRKIYSLGVKFHSERFVLFACPNSLGHHRFGFAVSRRVGCAVVRNRVKRLFREIFRKSFAEIPNSYDIVVNAKPASANAEYGVLREEMLGLVRRVCK